MDRSVEERLHAVEAFAGEILARLGEEVARLGFDTSEVVLQPAEEAVYRLEKDPASGQYSLVGDWLDKRGGKRGCLLFHADGSFFVEQDIVRPHPSRKQWFVEAVNAWGRSGYIKAEARLLRVPE